MTDGALYPSGSAIAAVLQQDAELIGVASRQPGHDKTIRQQARQWLWAVWTLLQPEDEGQQSEELKVVGADQPPVPDAVPSPADETRLTALLALVAQGEQLLKGLGHGRGQGIRALKHVLIHQPFPERPRLTACATLAQNHARRIAGHFELPMGIDEKRLTWFEQRCKEQNPTRVAMVRAPAAEGDQRESLEFLVKKGQSRFS